MSRYNLEVRTLCIHFASSSVLVHIAQVHIYIQILGFWMKALIYWVQHWTELRYAMK